MFRHQSNLVKAVLEEELDKEESLLNMLQGVWSSDRGVGGSVGKRILAELNLNWVGEGLTRQQGRRPPSGLQHCSESDWVTEPAVLDLCAALEYILLGTPSHYRTTLTLG